MFPPVLRHWDLGIYFNIYNPFFSFWLVTSKGNAVSHLHAGTADSTQAATEIRQAHGLTDFKRNTIPSRSSGIIAALKCCWWSAFCVLDTWQFLACFVPRVRLFQLTAWTLAAFNEHFHQNGSCYSAPRAPILSSWVYDDLFMLLYVTVFAWMISPCWISLTKLCVMTKILVPGIMVCEKS